MDSSNFSNGYLKEYFNKLKELLCKLGFKNKLVPINTVIKLYQTYGDGLTEETFATEVLDVSINKYKRAKKEGKNIFILKDKDILLEDDIEKLKLKLINLGYGSKSINYEEIKSLFKTYGHGLTESTFATKVLCLSYENYKRAKNDYNAKVIILKNISSVDEIIEELIKEGYENYIISSYSDFLEIYQKYGSSFTERFFAINVLKLTYDEHKNLKSNNAAMRILSTQTSDIEIVKIKNALKEKGFEGKKINYQEFLQLYEEYGRNLSEQDFALKVLTINLDRYKSIKYKNRKTEICLELKEKNNLNSIKKALIDRGLINKAIDYNEVQELYDEFGKELSEKEFAIDVLNITLDGYRMVRRKDNKDKIKILKEEIPKELERIKQILIEEGYSNKKIYYSELHELYLKYCTFITERQFAMQALGLSASHYQGIKYRYEQNIKSGAIILPAKKMAEEDIEVIRQELIKNGYEDAKLTYEEINDLYLKYNNSMSKSAFLQSVLGICSGKINKTHKTTILRKKDTLNENEIEKLKKEIF